MGERTLIPLTAAGLSKGDVPYPLGARQALALDVPADVEQLAANLGVSIPDAASFCATVQQLSDALPPIARSQLVGISFGESFFAWDGPVHTLPDAPPVPAPKGLDQALRDAGATPQFSFSEDVNNSRAAGLLPVYETDGEKWKRELLLPGNGDQHLLVRPPNATLLVGSTKS
jgi:hypothetical protein